MSLPATPPRIVVLDGFTLNPGDLNWDALRSLGTCEIHDRSDDADIVARAAGAPILLTNKTPLLAAEIEALPELRYIGVLATGVNVVNLAAARARGVTVTNVPAYATASVVELTFALLLELTLNVGAHAAAVRAGDWTRSPDFCFQVAPLVELHGRTLGIVGFGNIGRSVAKVAQALGMRVLVHRRAATIGSTEDGVRFVDLPALLRESDVVSLNCPLTAETKHLLDAATLALMKPGAWLINTGRGPLVDEAALADALNSGRLGGAGLDVLSLEPPPADNPLLSARNCIITPHIGWATLAARQRLMGVAVANVSAFLAGTPQNVVS